VVSTRLRIGSVLLLEVALLSIASLGCSIALPALINMAYDTDDTNRITGDSLLTRPAGTRWEVQSTTGRSVSGTLLSVQGSVKPDSIDPQWRPGYVELRTNWHGTIRLSAQDIKWATPLVTHPLVVAAVVVGVACDALVILAMTGPIYD
jgi:hypothetical protein